MNSHRNTAAPSAIHKMKFCMCAIAQQVCEADLLYPPIGKLPADIPYTREDLTESSDREPLSLDGPLHPDFAEPGQ